MTSLRILVVENHPSSNRVLTELLEKHGHVVAQALTAREALSVATLKKFELAFVNVGLPDNDGGNLLANLLLLNPRLRAIAITGYHYAAEMNKSGAGGFAAHLTLPIQPSALFEAIARIFPPQVQQRAVPWSGEASDRCTA
jgi:CheY-like chemotaxis protein